jgi:hypothetical protein
MRAQLRAGLKHPCCAPLLGILATRAAQKLHASALLRSKSVVRKVDLLALLFVGLISQYSDRMNMSHTPSPRLALKKPLDT